MSYGMLIMKITILFLFSSVFLGTNGNVSYVPKITERVFSCDNFDNKFLNCDDLKLGSLKGDDGDDTAKLSGSIETYYDIDSQYNIEIDIWKMLDIINEYMYYTQFNFCDTLQDSDSPLAPVFKEMNVSSCPIPVNTYVVHDMTISLNSVKDVLCHDFCGEYLIQMAIMNGTEKISCHVLEICIVEENDEDEE